MLFRFSFGGPCHYGDNESNSGLNRITDVMSKQHDEICEWMCIVNSTIQVYKFMVEQSRELTL